MLGLSTVFFANMLPSSRFDAAVREFSTTLRHARSLAMLSGERKTFIIDLDSKKYNIEGYNEKRIPHDIEIKVIDYLAGEVNRGKYNLTINPVGGIEGGAVVLWNKKKTANIEIDPIIGAVVVK